MPKKQGSGGLPGSTDYVALIGSASLSDAAARNVAAQPAYAGKVTILRPAVRAWLNDSERARWRRLSKGVPRTTSGTGSVYGASKSSPAMKNAVQA